MENNLETTDASSKKSSFDDLSREELISKCKGLLVIAQKAKQAKSELQTEVESYKLQFEKCVNEKEAYQDKIGTLQEFVNSLTEQKLNYITEIDTAQVRIKALSTKCNSFEEEIEKYKAYLIVKDKNIADTSQKLSDLDSELISLKRQNNRLMDENEQLINQLTELEARTTQFNDIGLQQREQLQMLEEKVQNDDIYKSKIEELHNTINELEKKIQTIDDSTESENQKINYENKIKELTQLYESEKVKKEKANIKLRSYKDKILKCAACINQLKNSRFILSKTVKEYSENIPKWQNDIIKASKVLDTQISELNKENSTLKEQIHHLEKRINELLLSQSTFNSDEYDSKITTFESDNKLLRNQLSTLQQALNDVTNNNNLLNKDLVELNTKYQHIKEIELPKQINENKMLTQQINEITDKFNDLLRSNKEITKSYNDLKIENQNLNDALENTSTVETLNLQIRALESEKAILVKEKLNARDVESRNKMLTDEVNTLKSEIKTVKSQLETLSQEKLTLESNYNNEKECEINIVKCKMMALQEKYDILKKEHEDMQDLNGLLKEEVETLKLSLEQPKDDCENLSDLNVSLQADIVKLETKLSAYKQENASLLSEIKEFRTKMKEYDTLVTENEDAKSKLLSYKTENTELLNEMKEINQVLKERGEAISKLQKAIAEMERLVETLEKDRDNMIQEKDELHKKNKNLECDLRNAEQKSEENNETTKKIILEKDNAIKSVVEKDAFIAILKEEIEKLKQQQNSSAELPNEDMSTSTISKAEEHSRMKDLDETFEEKYTKLRIFALKLKKKLNETTAQLQNAEQDKTKLEKLLSENGLADNKCLSSDDNVDSNEKKANTFIDKSQVSDLEAKVKSLVTALETSEKVAAELEKVKDELVDKIQQLTAEKEAHKITKDNLEKARRDAKKKNVLSLEMEDYERSMKELTTKMEEKKKKMVQMESTIDTQESTINTMKTQIKLLEEQIKTEETQNRLIKEELQHAIEEGKEKDNVIQVKNGIISKLEQDLEDEKGKNEESNLEMTLLLSDKEKVIMSLGEDKTELNNKVKRLEFKCGELNEKLRITNIELEDLKTEYTSYKVRAQAVLRQNQTVDHSQEEQLKEEAAALKTQIESLTAKLATAQEQSVQQTTEAESAKRRAAEAANEAARAQQRTTRLHADLARLSQQLESERTQQKLQISTLTQCYKTQINELETKLLKETEELRKQLLSVQEMSKSSKPRVSNMDDTNRNTTYILPVIPKEDGSDGEMDINVSMIPREEGEGSESAPSPPLSKSFMTSAGSGRSPVPLDRLLEEGVPDDEAMDATSLALTPEQEILELRRKLQAQLQRMKHVTVLLAESERECARNSQQSELLKAELRRVRGATQNAHNTEYMKNVTLKFLTLPPGDERSRLVPVLQKILTLTLDETHKIQAVAKGLDPNPGKGWGSYLPWPGGK